MASNLQRGSIILLVVLLLLDVSIAARFFHSNKKDYNIPKVDPYKVLGVKRQASDADIQKAYRRKARETHRESLHILLYLLHTHNSILIWYISHEHCLGVCVMQYAMLHDCKYTMHLPILLIFFF